MQNPGTPSDHSASVRRETNYRTTRRGLVAAAGAFAVLIASQKAHAFDLPPRDPGRGPGHNPGTSGGGHCLLRGTHVLTPKGEVKVEDLAVGDLVTTLDGTSKPIKWIGRRSHEAASPEAATGEALPVRIARSALGHLVPHTDLFVSSMHGLYIDGLLIPAVSLVNGRSIVRCRSIDSDTIEYFHIELDKHDVIFAEGAPTETLLAGNERAFDNWPEQVVDESHHELVPFAPRVPGNPSAVVRSRLRSAVSPLIDVRRPGDAVWERLAERAETHIAA